MAEGTTITGVNVLIKKLQERATKLKILGNKPKYSVIVGYTAEYAMYVHENAKAYHKPPTQWKFLEQPFREMRSEVSSMIETGLSQGLSIATVLLQIGYALLRKSLLICPVDTGALRGSGFCKPEE